MSEINLDTNKSLKEIFQTVPVIYSRLYTNADGTPAENNTIIEIETKKFQYRKDGEVAYYQWGFGRAQTTMSIAVKIIEKIGPLLSEKWKEL